MDAVMRVIGRVDRSLTRLAYSTRRYTGIGHSELLSLTNTLFRNKMQKVVIHHTRTSVFLVKTFHEEDYYDSV